MNRSRYGPAFLLLKACLILLIHSGCTVNDADEEDTGLLITLSPSRLMELGSDQSGTVTATLKDLLGNTYPADWKLEIQDRRQIIGSAVANPLTGVSSISVTVTARQAIYSSEEDSLLAPLLSRMGYVDLTAYPKDPLLSATHASIFVVGKMIEVSVQTHSVTIDLAQSVAQGKCTFIVKNDPSSDTYQWQKLDIRGQIQNSAGLRVAFAEPAVVGEPVINGRTAEFTWTQRLTTAVPVSGALVFDLKVGARSQNSPLLQSWCSPGEAVFYGNQGK
jgi:hypothetical protein